MCVGSVKNCTTNGGGKYNLAVGVASDEVQIPLGRVDFNVLRGNLR